ncbi:hypothetical protein LQW54_011082 [Pestalotiopsis sp. IQ-011]
MIKTNKLALEKAKKLQVYLKKHVPEPSMSKDASKGNSAPPMKKFKAPKPPELPPVPLNPSLQESKKYLDSRQSSLPRFFFRGFNASSGGGFDPRLNSKEGIVPHGFLGGLQPTNMYTIPALSTMIHAHLRESSSIQSQFSSWSAHLPTAILFARNTPTSHIAILDSRLMEGHVEVHHSVDLRKARLTSDAYDDEWLAYGPIKGAAFRCVHVGEITKIGFHSLFAAHGYAGHGLSKHYEKTRDEDALPAAKKVGKLFQGDEDQIPDIVLAVTAAFMGAHFQSRGFEFSEAIADCVTHALSDELQALETPKAQSFGAFRLANPIITCERPALSFMTSLLLSLERRAQALQAKALGSSQRASQVHYDLDIDGLEICSDDDV